MLTYGLHPIHPLPHPPYPSSTHIQVFGKDVENAQEIDGQSFEVGGEWGRKSPIVYFRGRPSNVARVNAMLATKDDPLFDIRCVRPRNGLRRRGCLARVVEVLLDGNVHFSVV